MQYNPPLPVFGMYEAHLDGMRNSGLDLFSFKDSCKKASAQDTRQMHLCEFVFAQTRKDGFI